MCVPVCLVVLGPFMFFFGGLSCILVVLGLSELCFGSVLGLIGGLCMVSPAFGVSGLGSLVVCVLVSPVLVVSGLVSPVLSPSFFCLGLSCVADALPTPSLWRAKSLFWTLDTGSFNFKCFSSCPFWCCLNLEYKLRYCIMLCQSNDSHVISYQLQRWRAKRLSLDGFCLFSTPSFGGLRGIRLRFCGASNSISDFIAFCLDLNLLTPWADLSNFTYVLLCA